MIIPSEGYYNKLFLLGKSLKHKKEELINLRFSFLQLTHYVSTTERQIIKLSFKYMGTFNLSSMIKYKAIIKSILLSLNVK